MIGTALVVTLKGGGSTTHIVLTKNAAGALRHVKKIPLDLRLTVRNAAIHEPGDGGRDERLHAQALVTHRELHPPRPATRPRASS